MNNVIQQSQTGKKTRGVFFFRLWIGFLIYLMGGFPTLVFALPQDGEIVSGQGSITASGNDMVVHQSSDKLIANWQSFNIGNGESVEFKQPSASSIALNNVIGLSPSVILGSLKSNGQVFLSNGSGVIFGQGAQVNVGGLLATTLGITNEDFLAGDYNFTQDASRPLSSVINRGLIEASYVGLLAPGVENTGTIVANLGSVNMASGKAASLDFVGDGLINFAITEAVDGDVLDDEGNVIDHRVKNAGLIQADGGRVVLSAKDAGNIIQNVVNNEGVIEAHSAVERNGEIFLMSGDSGVVANSGTLDASGKESGQTGGTVHMVGEKVGVFGAGVVDVSGNAGGGTALIGGDVQGGGDVQTATNTYVSEDAIITADAIENGDGGKVVVWADDTTRIYGSVSATGGALSGDGGFVETSGKNYLQITRAADVSSAFGLGGEWLIDPRDISIEAGNGNTNINSSNPFVSTGDSSILGVDLIVAALMAGTNVTISTGSDGTEAGDITLNADLDFNGTGTSTLSLIAHNDIILNNSILDSSAGGDTLNLVFTADSDLNGSGTLVVDAAASVESQGGSMQVTARDVDIQGTLDAGAGDITIAIAQQVAGTGEIQVGDAIYCPTCAMVISGQELQNITAANLTIENSTDAIFVDGITADNSNNIGTVVLDANGNIEFGRNAVDQTNASTFNALRAMSDAELVVVVNLTTDTGDMELVADADNSGGATEKITFLGAPDLISAGDITLSAAPGIYSDSHIDMIAGGTITINDDYWGVFKSTLTADNGIVFNGNYSSGEGIILNGDANGLVDGNDTITLADGIVLDAFAGGHIDFLSSIQTLGAITVLAGDRLRIDADFSSAGLTTFSTGTFSASVFSVASGATLNTNNNDLLITARDIDFQGNVNSGAGGTTISIAGTGRIQLGDASCGSCVMNINRAEIENITADSLTINNAAEAIFVDHVSAANSNNIGTVVLNSGRHIAFRNNASTFNALTVNATTDIDIHVNLATDTGDLVLSADTDASGGSDRIFLVSGPSLTSAGDLVLNSSASTGIYANASSSMTAGGAITLNALFNANDSVTMAAGDSITLNDAFTAGGSSTLNADDGVNVNGDFTVSGTIRLNGDANSSVDGSDTVVFADGVTVTSLSGGNINLQSSVSTLGVTTFNAGDSVNLFGDFNALGLTTFNTGTFSNSVFSVASGATLNTNNNDLLITAHDVDLQGNINGGIGGITISMAGTGRLQLGDASCGSCVMNISGSELQNITAGSLTINNAAEAIFVDNVSAANSDNIGTVVLNSGRHIAFRNNASTFNALTVNATTDVDVHVKLTTDTGDLVLTADSDSSGGSDRIFLDSSPSLTSAGDLVLNSSTSTGIFANTALIMTAGGSITLNALVNVNDSVTMTATGGSIQVNGAVNAGDSLAMIAGGSITLGSSVTANSSVAMTATSGSIDVGGALNAGTSVSMTSGSTITLNNTFTAGGSATLNADDGINVNGNFTASGNVVLNGDANSSADGNDTVVLASGITVESSAGSVSFDSAASALGAITVLAANGIDINGAFTSLGATVFDADSDGNDPGVFTVSALGSVLTNNNTLSINARDVDLQGTVSAGALGDIVLSISGVGKIQLGDASCGNCVMNISGSELQNITAGSLTINSAADAIFVDNVSAANSDNIGTVVLNSGRHIAFRNNASTFNALTVNATTDVDVLVDLTTDTGNLVLNADTDSSGGSDRIFLASSPSLTSAGDLVLNASTSTGIFANTALTMTAGGSITLNASVNVNDSATMTSGGTIALNDTFTAGGSATLNADDGINVNGDFSASGNVVLNGDANSFVDGNDTVVLASGITVESTTGSLSFGSAVSALGAITALAANGIDINGAFSSQGSTIFNSDTDANGAGTFTVAATGSINTNNSILSITSNDINLAGTLNAGTSDITLLVSDNGTIGLGSATGGMTISGAELQNVTAANFIIGSSANGDVTVNEITDIDSDNIGLVTLNSGGSITFTGADSTFNALTVNANADINVFQSLRTEIGDLVLNADADSTGGSDRIYEGAFTSIVSAGDLILNAGAGTIVSQIHMSLFANGSITLENDVFAGSGFSARAGGSITANGDITASDFTVQLAADNGININGNITAKNSISISANQSFYGPADGVGTITFADGVIIESMLGVIGMVDSVEAIALGGLTLKAAEHIYIDTDLSTSGTTVILADSDANGSGLLSVGVFASGSIDTNNNDLFITAADVDLLGNVDVGTADIDIQVSDNGTIGLGNAAGDMSISRAELQNITAANLTLGGATTGNVGVNGITAANSNNVGTVTLNSGGSVDFSGDASTFNALAVGQSSVVNVNAALSTDTGALDISSVGNININANVTSATNSSLSAGGSITTTAATITATALTTFSTSGINISTQVSSLNFFNGVSGDVVVNNSGALSLSGSNFNGNLSVTAGGAITQGPTSADSIFVSGNTTINAAGQDITLTNGLNSFGGSVSLLGNNVALTAGAIDLGASTISGTLSVISSSGSITDSGPVTVVGTTTLVANAGGDVILDNAGNDFGGTVSVDGRNVTLVDQNAIDIGTSEIAETFSVTAGGAVTDSGTLLALGDTNINAVGNDITLDGFVFFGGAVSVAGANVTLVAQTSIDLGASTITGNLNVTTEDGAVTQSGALTVAGTTDIDADGFAVYDVTLNTLGNDFGGAVSITGKDVSIFDSNDIDFGASTTTGTFNVLAGGDITQSGALNIAGASNLAGVNIVLTNASNDFIGTVSASGSLLGGNVSLTDINAIDLGTSNVNGDYMVTAGGAVTQSGALSVTGMTMISAVGQNVILTNAANDFIGDVGIDANNVQISDTNSIAFKASTVTGSLTVNANDGVTINGAISTGDASSINADSDANGSGTFAVTAAGSILTNNNTLSITADDFDLQGTLNVGLSDITVLVSDNGTIGLGNTAGDMTIDGSELQNITAANLILGSTTNGNVTVDGISAANSDNIGTVTINSGGNIDFNNNDSVFNAMNIHAVTDIHVNTNLETDTGNFVAIADFELNNIGEFNLGSGATVTSALDIDITAEIVNLNGNLNAGGTITINGEIFADEAIFLYAVDGIIITEDINNNESITIDADTNRDGIGDFELVGGVLIKSNGFDISITANDFIIDGIIDAGLGNVTLVSSVGGSIGLGEAWGDIRIDNSELQNITAGNLIIGDEKNSNVYVKNVQAVDVANISELTLNATRWGKSVYFYGPASNLNDLTVNASNDVRVYGGLTAKDTIFNAGDDVKLWGGTYSFDSLTAVADDDIIIYGTLNTVNADYTAGDDIWLDGYQTYTGNLNATAGDDITIDWELTAATATLTAGDDVRIYGTTHFGDLTVDAGDDISIRGDHQTTGTADLTAVDDISMRNSLSFGELNVTAGDNISVNGTLDATHANFTATAGDVRLAGTMNMVSINAHAGDDIYIKGDVTVTGGSGFFNSNVLNAADDVYLDGINFAGRVVVNAGDDINLRGDNSIGVFQATAGDDIHLHGANSIGSLLATAGDDIHIHGEFVSTFITLNANDDIKIHGNISTVGLMATAGGSISIDSVLTSYTGTLTSGDDTSIKGTTNFSTLTINAGDDIHARGDLTVTGSSFMSAGDDIYMKGQFTLGAWTAIAGDDIRLKGNYNLTTADLKANDEIRIDRATVNSGNFSAEADFDNNDSGAFKLEKHSSITSTGDVDLSGYGLKLKGDLTAAGTLTLTDKSAGNLLINENISAGSFTIHSGGNVTINSTGNILIIDSVIAGNFEVNTDGDVLAQTDFNPGSGSIVFQSSIISSPTSGFSTINLGSGITGSISSSSASVNLYSVSAVSPSIQLGLLNFSSNSGVILVSNN
jgi:filamentous hemagglutinin family protein